MKSHLQNLRIGVLAPLLSAFVSSTCHADTVAARCELVPHGASKATVVTNCTFSQRQGAVGIQLSQGTRFDFAPGTDSGRYTDQNGAPVFRQAGLKHRGVIFRMKAQTLYVYWRTVGQADLASQPGTGGQSPAAKALLALPEASAPYAQDFRWGKHSFHVQSKNDAGPNTVRITPAGLTVDNRVIERQVHGQVIGGEVADINRDGSAELYLYIRSNDQPPRCQLLAFSVNRGKSVSDIVLAPLSSEAGYSRGYRGWDQFAVVEASLVQRFPVFADDATDMEPTTVRQIRYRLRVGEANWQLVADRVDEFY